MTTEALRQIDERLAPGTYEALKEQWSAFVDQLDHYPFSIYDYDNDIDSRALIAEVTADLTVDVQVSVWEDLHPLDAKFITKTNQQPRRKYPLNAWHSRLPKKPGEELTSDMEAEQAKNDVP